MEKTERRDSKRLRLTVALALLAACGTTPTPPRYDLPADPKAKVVELRKNSGPVVTVLADGTVRTRNGTTMADAGSVQDLLEFIVDGQGFFEINPAALKLAVHQSNSRYGGAIAVLDGTTTGIEVRLRDRQHAVEQFALAFSAQRYSEISGLQRLAAIESEVIRFAAIQHLGGRKAAERILRAANKQLKADFPKLPPLGMANLSTAGTRKDGARVAHFRRAGSPTTVTVATVVVPEDGKPTAKVRSNEIP